MLKKLKLQKRKQLVLEKFNRSNETMKEMRIREAGLEKALEEAESEEDIKLVEGEIDKFTEEKEAAEKENKDLETELSSIDSELEELDKNEPTKIQGEEPAAESNIERSSSRNNIEEREGGTLMKNRRKYFGGVAREQLVKHVEREDVKQFLVNVREKVVQRSLKNSDILIPEITLELLRDNLHQYSKLIDIVDLRKIAGKARQIIAGDIPEAVWTEACAKLNELDLSFNEIEIDGYKVGGYIPVCNATLEDAKEVDLYNEILFMLGQALGLAIDKAILYGTGKKMPLGIVTRLAQSSQPEGYSDKARKWVDLHTSNIVQVAGDTGEKFYADMLLKTKSLKSNYVDGQKFWVMNEATHKMHMAKALAFNAAGALVASADSTMPILGGTIIELPFIPDGDVIGGYGKAYALGERAGATFNVSEHVQFIEDNTIFKGTARYDGKPKIAESFIAFNINGGTVTTTMTFAPDKANEVVPGV